VRSKPRERLWLVIDAAYAVAAILPVDLLDARYLWCVNTSWRAGYFGRKTSTGWQDESTVGTAWLKVHTAYR
jgi:hypothetical protein